MIILNCNFRIYHVIIHHQGNQLKLFMNKDNLTEKSVFG